MNDHIENPTAYSNAIKQRMIRNSVVGKLQRLATEHPMLLRLITEVIEPARERQNVKYNAQRERECVREGWDFTYYDFHPLFDLSNIDMTAGFIVSLKWSEVDSYSFPEQLVIRYLKTKKGLSPKQDAWVTKIVEEEPVRAAKVAERRQARQELDAASTHVGEVKDRLKDMEVTIDFAKTLDGGDYGPKRIVKMRDTNGNLFVTFATSEWVWGAEKGARYLLTGTVKEHSEYEGTKQTVLTRTKGVPYDEV